MKKTLFPAVFCAILGLSVFLFPVAAFADAVLTVSTNLDKGGASVFVNGVPASSAGQINLKDGDRFSVSAKYAGGYKAALSGDCSVGSAASGASYNCQVSYTQNAQTSTRTSTNTDTGNLYIVKVAQKITTFVWELFFLFAVIMLVVAGMLFLFARGDPEKLKTARAAFLWSIVGIIVAIAAYFMVDLLRGILGV